MAFRSALTRHRAWCRPALSLPLTRSSGFVSFHNFTRLSSRTPHAATAFTFTFPSRGGGGAKEWRWCCTASARRRFSSTRNKNGERGEQEQAGKAEGQGQGQGQNSGGGAGAGGENGGGNGKSFWGTYNRWLLEYPLLTKSLTSALIVAVGDIAAQIGIEGAAFGELNWRRVGNMLILGGVVIGPTLHFWYGALMAKIPAPTTMAAIQRLALDQAFFAPFFIGVIFTTMFGMEGRLEQLPDHMEKEYLPSVLTNWQLWIPAQFVTFRFIPATHQVLFVNFVALIWNTYLSWVGHKASHRPSPEPEVDH